MPKFLIVAKKKKIVKENAIFFFGMFRNILFLRSLGLTLSLIFEGGPCLSYLPPLLLALGESIVNIRGQRCALPTTLSSECEPKHV
jgi:hypothetical protein